MIKELHFDFKILLNWKKKSTIKIIIKINEIGLIKILAIKILNEIAKYFNRLVNKYFCMKNKEIIRNKTKIISDNTLKTNIVVPIEVI